MANQVPIKSDLGTGSSIEPAIVLLRGQRVILDSELARIYGVSTKALNQAVKRNADRFPTDFMLRLTESEWKSLRSQLVTSKQTRGGRRYAPLAFTEHGAIMAANVLNSQLAITMSIYVVRAFIKLRESFFGYAELKNALKDVEQKLTNRQKVHEKAIVKLFQQIERISDAPFPLRVRRQIGFRVSTKKK